MSIFLIETDTLSNAAESIFNSSQELLDLSETVGSYSVENDEFDFASAKNKISENINKMNIKTSNIAQVISFAADVHTAVQNSIKCQASEGLDIQSVSSNTQGTSQPVEQSGNNTTPTTPVVTPSNNSSDTTEPTTPTVNNPSNPSPGNTTPSVVIPSTNDPQPEPQKFVNYYLKDYSSLITAGETIVTAGGASTAIAMVLSAVKGEEITPVETTEWGVNNKDNIQNEQGEMTYFDNIAKAYNIECESIELTKENILKNISEGKYMILSMEEGKFGNNGNYVVITGITEDGKIKIADPNSVENTETTWDLSLFLEEGIKLWGFSKPIEKNS